MNGPSHTEHGTPIAGGEVAADRAAAYRDVRRDSELAVPPVATSVDGRRFQFQASLYELPFRAGGYVLLANNRLGQILTIGLEPGRCRPNRFRRIKVSPGRRRSRDRTEW